MKTLGTVVCAISLLLPAFVEASTSWVAVASPYSPLASPARINMKAEFVAVSLTVHSDEKETLKRTDKIEEGLRQIANKVAQHGDLQIRPGTVSLRPSRLLSNYTANHDPSLFSSKISSYSNHDSFGASAAQLYVLVPMKSDSNVLAATRRIYEVVRSVPLAKGTEVSLGAAQLGIDNPEKYRIQLFGLIAKLIADIRKHVGPTTVLEVEGLETPVVVMQVDDANVSVFIDFRLNKVQLK